MNGAESLVRTLVGGGVNVCFTNPGTSEMHFVAALDALPPGDWQPEALEALVQRATRVTAREGQVHTTTLRLNRR